MRKRAEPAVFGPVASAPTVSRLIDTLAESGRRALATPQLSPPTLLVECRLLRSIP